jgi:hypothetical protein
MFKKSSLMLFAAFAATTLTTSVQAADDERLVSLNDPVAAFLETREYAKKMGASAEFRKMEGVAYDQKNNKLYIAMSSIDKSMSDKEGEVAPEICTSR